MENLLELLRKYNMTNEDVLSTSGSPLATTNISNNGMNMGVSQDMGLENQSLLGSDKRTNNTLSLMGLLGSPEALTGLGLIAAGTQGKRVGESLLPAFTEGLKVSSAVRTMTKEQEQQKAIDEFADKVPEQYKPLFKAFPKETMKLLLTPKTPTLSGEALKVAEKLKGLSGSDFQAAYQNLSQVEKDLFTKEIVGTQDIIRSAQRQQELKTNIPSGSTSTQTPMDIKSTDIFKKFKQANPNVPEDLLIEEIKKKYPNTIKG